MKRVRLRIYLEEDDPPKRVRLRGGIPTKVCELCKDSVFPGQIEIMRETFEDGSDSRMYAQCPDCKGTKLVN